MKYAIEMGPGAVICVPSLINTGWGIQNTQQGDLISLLLFIFLTISMAKVEQIDLHKKALRNVCRS
jgi:hypothetical protein